MKKSQPRFSSLLRQVVRKAICTLNLNIRKYERAPKEAENASFLGALRQDLFFWPSNQRQIIEFFARNLHNHFVFHLRLLLFEFLSALQHCSITGFLTALVTFLHPKLTLFQVSLPNRLLNHLFTKSSRSSLNSLGIQPQMFDYPSVQEVQGFFSDFKFEKLSGG